MLGGQMVSGVLGVWRAHGDSLTLSCEGYNTGGTAADCCSKHSDLCTHT
jgi:hypothetical protein